MHLDLVPIWTLILGVAVFMYVLLDGFDLGVGMLFPLAPDDRARDLMMASVAPIWDGNETWLVLGGIALFAAFPLAFAIILPALYFPILAMLLGLVFGYGLLGATWLVMKTEGALQDWAREMARWCLFGVLAFIAMVSIWTPFLDARIAARWFSWPNLAFLAPVPAITAVIAWWLWVSLKRGREVAPFVAAMGLFAMC